MIEELNKQQKFSATEQEYLNIAKECRNINIDFTFTDVIFKHSTYSRNGCINWFAVYEVWRFIPKEFLYREYKNLLNSEQFGFQYSYFFKSELICEIMKVNKYDTVENKELISLLDSDGYLTVYHGHCKPTMRNSYSWTIDKNVAEFFGRRNARFHSASNYYIVTGKVKLEDVIAFIDEEDADGDAKKINNEKEIVVLNKNVKKKSKKIYEYKE